MYGKKCCIVVGLADNSIMNVACYGILVEGGKARDIYSSIEEAIGAAENKCAVGSRGAQQEKQLSKCIGRVV